MKIELTETLIESVLPNVVVTVEGETGLAQRVAPYIEDSRRWLEANLLGDFEPENNIQDMAARAVAMHALIMAIPALDLVATPTGFGVISSSNLAPASKERIERLIDKLSTSLDELLCQLQSACIAYESWRKSSQGCRFCSTFLCWLRDVNSFPRLKGGIFTRYDTIASEASRFERVLGEKYIGPEILDLLRGNILAMNLDYMEVISRIRQAETHLVSRRLESPRCPDDHEVWHDARHIIHSIRRVPELQEMYLDFRKSQGYEEFPKNPSRQGGYFF